MQILKFLIGALLISGCGVTISELLPPTEVLPPKERLGEALFFDPKLSSPAGQSCASCHDSSRAFSTSNQTFPSSEGAIKGRFSARNTPTAMYAAFSPHFHFDQTEGLYLGGQFVDGRAATLEEQAKGPFLNPLEMNNPNAAAVVEKVRASAYADMFRQVYGPAALDDVDSAFDKIAEAIAAFERRPLFNRFTSKYDAYLAGNARLTSQELRGMRAFEDEKKGNCAACHPSRPAADGTPPLFTDFSYDNLGVGRNPHNRFYQQAAQFNPDGRTFVDRGLGAFTKLASEDGKFKVPTLRNVTRTAPYLHNGYFNSLRNVVDFYNTRDVKPACKNPFTDEASALRQRCWPVPEVGENVNTDELGNLKLSDQEVDDIVAFMHTLTDGWKPHSRGH